VKLRRRRVKDHSPRVDPPSSRLSRARSECPLEVPRRSPIVTVFTLRSRLASGCIASGALTTGTAIVSGEWPRVGEHRKDQQKFAVGVEYLSTASAVHVTHTSELWKTLSGLRGRQGAVTGASRSASKSLGELVSIHRSSPHRKDHISLIRRGAQRVVHRGDIPGTPGRKSPTPIWWTRLADDASGLYRAPTLGRSTKTTSPRASWA